ncbi:acetate kinase [Candidatus Peregrinibacteria bacterium CG_4_9_14_0_2_um_filter_53_11]|nr:MAG: acetate kinase [Candidatus Peregrinibacteria bacterium CG_4_9_14_0_2_um_filter_53_11]
MNKKTPLILVINAGSSSVKYAVFAATKTLPLLFSHLVDGHGSAIKDYTSVIEEALEKLTEKGIVTASAELVAVGHRVVHGGSRYTQPTEITPTILKAIDKLSELAPLHNPANSAGIKACRRLLPKALQLAIFDTAFHHTIPEYAALYALPHQLSTKEGIRRYGFHGISHEYVYEKAREKLGALKTAKTVSCHLGNGCSITAILKGSAVDTSMGLTPLEGVPMGTRSGDIDPAIIFHLAKKGMKIDRIEHLLNKESGLLGLSGISSDMRLIHAAALKGKPGALRALAVFSYRIAKYIASYAGILGGLDCLIFTGGIGEHADYLRKMVLEHLKGIKPKIILVIPTNEEKKIAEEVYKMLRQAGGKK